VIHHCEPRQIDYDLCISETQINYAAIEIKKNMMRNDAKGKRLSGKSYATLCLDPSLQATITYPLRHRLLT